MTNTTEAAFMNAPEQDLPKLKDSAMDEPDFDTDWVEMKNSNDVQSDENEPGNLPNLPLGAFIANMIYHRLNVDELEWK